MRKALYFMGVLGDSDLEWLATHGKKHLAPTGSTLINEGQPIDWLIVVLDGQLSVVSKATRGKSVATLRSGEIAGEISFVDSRPPMSSLIATEDSHLLLIPRDKLRRKLEADMGFAARFYRAVALFLADRMRTTSGRLGFSAAQDPEAEVQDGSELDDDWLDNASNGAMRFDGLLRRLTMNGEHRAY